MKIQLNGNARELTQEEIIRVQSKLVEHQSIKSTSDKENSKKKIRQELAELDDKSVRALRDIALNNGDIPSGPDNKTPRQRIEDIESQRAALVAQLQ